MCWSRLGECARAIQCKRHNSRLETVENREDMESVTYWGTLLEPMVATAYTQKTGIRARKPNVVLQHPTFPYLLAKIHHEIVGRSDVQILEFRPPAISASARERTACRNTPNFKCSTSWP